MGVAERSQFLGEFHLLARPALNAVYTIAGRRLLIEAHDDWSAEAVADLFNGWFLDPLAVNGAAPPDVTMEIRCGISSPRIPDGLFEFDIPQDGICYTDGRTHYLDFNGSRVVIGPGLARDVRVWVKEHYDFGSQVLAQIISQAFSAALRRCGLFEFHSAGLIPPGHDQAVLIAGGSGSGKSTLTLQLAACGWRFLSDDTLLLENSDHAIEVHALRKFFALTADTITAMRMPQLEPAVAVGTLKERVTPLDLFPQGQVQRSKSGAIFFPTLSYEAESRIQKLSPTETMGRLLRLCPWAAYDKPTANEHLSVLGALARNSAAFDLFAGTDLLEDQTLVARLCLRELQA
jgi:hypothetical protein